MRCHQMIFRFDNLNYICGSIMAAVPISIKVKIATFKITVHNETHVRYRFIVARICQKFISYTHVTLCISLRFSLMA